MAVTSSHKRELAATSVFPRLVCTPLESVTLADLMVASLPPDGVCFRIAVAVPAVETTKYPVIVRADATYGSRVYCLTIGASICPV